MQRFIGHAIYDEEPTLTQDPKVEVVDIEVKVRETYPPIFILNFAIKATSKTTLKKYLKSIGKISHRLKNWSPIHIVKDKPPKYPFQKLPQNFSKMTLPQLRKVAKIIRHIWERFYGKDMDVNAVDLMNASQLREEIKAAHSLEYKNIWDSIALRL